jgi:hypothetical protein
VAALQSTTRMQLHLVVVDQALKRQHVLLNHSLVNNEKELTNVSSFFALFAKIVAYT